jgi:hypothetical protein
MISRTYDARRETARFVWRTIEFAFGFFRLVVAQKRKGAKSAASGR